MDPNKILIRPIITEKASLLEKEGKYTFEVSPKANKIEIKKAIEKIYKVKPLKINIIKLKGKQVRSGWISGRRKNWKKAIVTLRKGEKIDLTSSV
ncbi:MAG: 50S ribosomal protein L23 [Patescibacteria group bacterium]